MRLRLDVIGRRSCPDSAPQLSCGITPGGSAGAITTGPDGNLWVTEETADRIARITPAGVVTEFSVGHVATSGFSDTRSGQEQISLGASYGRRRMPSLLDVGQAKLLMWDGRHDALYNRPFGPLESVVEFNSSRLFMAEQMFLIFRSDYEAVFGPMPPLDDTAQFPALGAFERLLTCGASPFDTWMHGGAPVSRAAQRGAALFVGAGGCVKCHSGPFMRADDWNAVT